MRIRIQKTSGRRQDRRTDGPVSVLESTSEADAQQALDLINDALDSTAYGSGWDGLIVHTSSNVNADAGPEADWSDGAPDGWDEASSDIESVMGLFDHAPTWDGSPTRWDGNNHSECPIWAWACANNALAPQQGEAWAAAFDNDCAYPTVTARDGWTLVAQWGDCGVEIYVDAPDGVEIEDGELAAHEDDEAARAWIEALGELEHYHLCMDGCDGSHALFARTGALADANAAARVAA